MAEAQMWQLYQFHGHRVRVIQQWTDPYGVSFVRIETDDGAMAEGMAEDVFLKDAERIAE
jgi:hypothetical protein